MTRIAFGCAAALAACACARVLAGTTLTVAPDGSAQYTTVQAAVDAVPANNTQRVTILIAPGVYFERLTLPTDKPFITLRGQDPSTTILTYNLNAHSPDGSGGEVGTTGSSSTFVNGNDFIAENVTFANSTANGVGQAVAVKTQADRLIFRNCRFTGWQDTLYANRGSGPGRQYYEDCFIEGDVDFIFGNGRAYFENCEIRSKEPGYVTAQSKDDPNLYSGYVFHNCRLTRTAAAGNASVYLGRPWRPYATVVYDSCWMEAHIRPQGWHNWNDPNRELTAFYAEYSSSGPGGDPSGRVTWSHQLTAQEVEAYNLSNWLGGDDHWNPIPEPMTCTLLALGATALLRRRSR